MRLRTARRRADQRGLSLSSPLALLSAAAVVVAGAAFFATGEPREPDVATPVTAEPAPSEGPTSKAPRPVLKKKPTEPPVRRGQVYVEVYNNSGIAGLAGRTATRASGAGWQVVGSDNWYGTIPASTVYFPPRLAAEAKLLGRDLGIRRIQPAIAPMRLDRLTVILTTDFAR